MKHTGRWKQYALKMNRLYGYDIKRVTTGVEKGVENYRSSQLPVKYMFVCKSCGAVIYRKRESRFTRNYRNYICTRCGTAAWSRRKVERTECVTQVAVGKRECLTIFGNDYPTKDGTCTRDYIHVVDLAKGHVKAIDYILKSDKCCEIFNLGTGTPYSVTEIVKTFERVNGVKVNHVYGLRRAGDLPECYANADKALKILGWKTEKTLEDMCRDSWNWQKQNPNGYGHNN